MKRLSTDFDPTSVNKTPRLADGQVENERRLCFKFLAPAHLAASIMGPKGKIIQAIQGETNTTIQFSDRGFNYASTRSRLATVIGNRAEDLFGAMIKVIEHVHECITQQAQHANAHPPDSSDLLSADNQVFIMIIPKIMRGVVIGAGGSQVAELREQCACKIRLDEGMTPSESMVKIEGALEGILKVCQWIIEQIENVCDDESFRLWIKGHGNISTRDGNKQNNKQSRQVDNNMPRARNPLREAGEDALSGYSNFITPKPTVGRSSARTQNNSVVSNMASPNMSAIIEKVGAEVNFGEKSFTLQLPIPLDFKGALIGKGGHGVKEILHEAHCASLNVQDIQGTEECTVRIEGSVMACSAAYLLVMRRYAIYARQRQHAIEAANRQLQQ